MVVNGWVPSSWVYSSRFRYEFVANFVVHRRLFSLRAYVVKALACCTIQTVIHSMRFQRIEASHPVIFARLKLTSVFRFAVLVMIPDLFDQRKLRMLVKVVAWERKMVVKRSPGGLVYIVAMSIDPQIRRRLALSDILGLLA